MSFFARMFSELILALFILGCLGNTQWAAALIFAIIAVIIGIVD